MIFVTTGTQLPFPRLIDAMEAIAAKSDERILAQTGAETGAAARWPHLELHSTLRPEAFEAAFREARLIVGHAGIGTVLSAQRFRKPLILLPRRTALGEHRNDHQMATARQLDGRQGLTIAWEADALAALVAETGQPPMGGADAAPALADFLTRLSRIIAQ